MSTSTLPSSLPAGKQAVGLRVALIRVAIILSPFALAFAAWFLVTAIFNPPAATLASPAAVWAELFRMAGTGELWQHFLASVRRLFIGIPIGVVSGLAVGFAVGRSRRVAQFVEPLASLFIGISGLAWIPLAILWFGIGDAMVTFIVWNAVFFVVMLNTAAGVRSVPLQQEQAIRTLGGGRLTVLRQVIFPGALPHIMLGIRTGVGFAWRSLIAAELIGATLGLGQLIYAGMAYFRSDIVIGGCIMLGLLGLLTDRLILGPIERRTVERWGMLRRSES